MAIHKTNFYIKILFNNILERDTLEIILNIEFLLICT